MPAAPRQGATAPESLFKSPAPPPPPPPPPSEGAAGAQSCLQVSPAPPKCKGGCWRERGHSAQEEGSRPAFELLLKGFSLLLLLFPPPHPLTPSAGGEEGLGDGFLRGLSQKRQLPKSLSDNRATCKTLIGGESGRAQCGKSASPADLGTSKMLLAAREQEKPGFFLSLDTWNKA